MLKVTTFIRALPQWAILTPARCDNPELAVGSGRCNRSASCAGATIQVLISS